MLAVWDEHRFLRFFVKIYGSNYFFSLFFSILVWLYAQKELRNFIGKAYAKSYLVKSVLKVRIIQIVVIFFCRNPKKDKAKKLSSDRVGSKSRSLAELLFDSSRYNFVNQKCPKLSQYFNLSLLCRIEE